VTPAANLKQVTLQLAPSPDLPNCETDASRVEQILVNLLGNAIKYAPERSTVRVNITSRERRIVYQIEDEGPGVPPGEVERIFDIYVTKAGEEGRGLADASFWRFRRAHHEEIFTSTSRRDQTPSLDFQP
jgi:signal transduction histidine kinase